jgi:hypothetical protein
MNSLLRYLSIAHGTKNRDVTFLRRPRGRTTTPGFGGGKKPMEKKRMNPKKIAIVAAAFACAALLPVAGAQAAKHPHHMMRIATPPIPSMPLAPLRRMRSARPAPSPLTSPRHGRVTAGRVTTGRRAPGVTTSAIRRPSAAVPTVHGPSTNRSSFYEQRCKRRPKRPPLFMRSAGSSAEATLVVAAQDIGLMGFFTSAAAGRTSWPNRRNATQLRPDALFRAWRLSRRPEAEAKPSRVRLAQKR